MQIAAPAVAAIVDPLADGIDLAPFFPLLKNPRIVKVLHAGRQDIEIFWYRGRVIPDPLFDTQIVAMVCGFGEAASYETLARKIAHAEVDKSARFTDWARRPLSKRQLEYALADVTHLCTIYEALSAQLAKSKRESWVAEEIAALKSEELYALDPVHAWKRLKPRTANKRFLATLAAVAAWREREAQTRDTPRNRVLKDEVLLEIAANPPDSAEALERHPRGAERLRRLAHGQEPAGGRGGRPRRAAARSRRAAGAQAAQARAVAGDGRSAENLAPAAGPRKPAWRHG